MGQQETATIFKENWRSSNSKAVLQHLVLERWKAREKLVYNCLDVGCGNGELAKGTVNVDLFREGQNLQIGEQLKGQYVNPRSIPNFVVADACHLPFRKGSFNMVFSSHVIEHVENPFAMLSEMHRVAKRKVAVRCPHRKGSGAKRPFHINYLDEEWFKLATAKLGCQENVLFPNIIEGFFTSKIPCPERLKKTLPWRAFRHLERRLINPRIRVPFEVESWSILRTKQHPRDHVHFVVVYNDEKTLERCFKRGIGVTASNTTVYRNKNRIALPTFYNDHIVRNLAENVWLAFCHQDFILKSNLEQIMNGLDSGAIYGVIGARYGLPVLFGRIMQTDSSGIGLLLDKPEPVQTVDEMCIIVHSSFFRKGFRFDERFKFHFYGADLCLQAYNQGFDVKALQVTCQHKSRTLEGDLDSTDYAYSKQLFKEKWKRFFPIRTTTTLMEK